MEKPATPWGHDLKADEHGEYRSPSGGLYPSVLQLFWFEELEFCGCGEPGKELLFLRNALSVFAIDDYDQRCAAVRNLFQGQPDFERHYLYWLDRHDLIEHGSSLHAGAWISDKGRTVLLLLETGTWQS